jgi:hypothetical protein
MTDAMFGHRYTAIPDSGVVELRCVTHVSPVTWKVGYHPSLDVLIDQARAHDVAGHDNDSGASVADVSRLRGIVCNLLDLFGVPDDRLMQHADVTRATLQRYAAEAGVRLDGPDKP